MRRRRLLLKNVLNLNTYDLFVCLIVYVIYKDVYLFIRIEKTISEKQRNRCENADDWVH